MTPYQFAMMQRRAWRPLLLVAVFLVSFGPVRSAERPPAVYLTHFFIVLDQPSYEALRDSTAIAELATVKDEHVVAGDRDWTGFAIFGRQTYMEFFGAGRRPPTSADSGLALTVEEKGGVAAIAARLRTAFGANVRISKTRRTANGKSIPWFRSVKIESDGRETMETWIMEIDPGYLAAMHPDANIENPLSREKYLSWQFRPDLLLDDVVALKAAIEPPAIPRLAQELEITGWTVQSCDEGFIATGPDVTLTVVPAGDRSGFQQVDLRLRRAVPRQEVKLGNVTLLLDGEQGHLLFRQNP
jgi:hypothetical protein